ncbi:c-type cytochrome [Pseudooceanicola onchidii]|uniref:c-type cytochrome n=1 Tax=Pseudooceanicola onchidii TaxID=2562279 RepID=UPI0010AAB512|nr:cytochrome c [Pseudooceanicola onchidii]
MNKIIPAALAIVAVAGGAYYLTRPGAPAPSAQPAEGEPIVSITVPDTMSADAMIGQRAFDATCAACHGTNASGKQGFGPPLVHKIYEPNHHADMAFQMAVQNGVRSHHWTFGDMPAQSGLTKADVGNIVAYVRELQRANGIE